MNIVIPDDLLLSTRMSEQEITQEIAVMLFEKDKLTLGQVAHLAQLGRLRFQHLLASRGIPVHYDVAQIRTRIDDAATIRDKMIIVSNTSPIIKLANVDSLPRLNQLYGNIIIPLLDDLIAKAGFWVDNALYQQVLQIVGENVP